MSCPARQQLGVLTHRTRCCVNRIKGLPLAKRASPSNDFRKPIAPSPIAIFRDDLQSAPFGIDQEFAPAVPIAHSAKLPYSVAAHMLLSAKRLPRPPQ